MKLAIVHDWLTGMRGGEKCLERICRRFPDARLFTLIHAAGSASPAIDRMSITTSFLQRLPGADRHYRYLLPLMPRAIEAMKIPAEVDVVLSFSHAVAKGIITPPGTVHICYCFTPMRYAWHLRGEYFDTADAHCAGARGFAGRIMRRPISKVRDRFLDRLRDWDQATSHRVTQFVAASQTIRRRIHDCYGCDAKVIYPPVDTDYYTPDFRPRADFYLCVSALVPYKRIDLAIAACNRLGRPLIVIGRGPESRRLARLAGPTVRLLGWQPQDVVRQHMRRCRALLFPGHEDFGIVPVEAQACGAPVIAFDQGGVTESVVPPGRSTRGSGLFFKEPTPDSLAAAIRWFEQHPRRISADLARRGSERFAAGRFERELVALLDQASGISVR